MPKEREDENMKSITGAADTARASGVIAKAAVALIVSILVAIGACVPASAIIEYADPITSTDVYVVDVSYSDETGRYLFKCAAQLIGYPNGYTPFTFGIDGENITNADGSAASEDEILAFKTLTISWDGIAMESYPLQLGLVYSAAGSAQTSLTPDEQDELAALFDLSALAVQEPDESSGEDTDDADINPPTGIAICTSLTATAAAAVYVIFNRKK